MVEVPRCTCQGADVSGQSKITDWRLQGDEGSPVRVQGGRFETPGGEKGNQAGMCTGEPAAPCVVTRNQTTRQKEIKPGKKNGGRFRVIIIFLAGAESAYACVRDPEAAVSKGPARGP